MFGSVAEDGSEPLLPLGALAVAGVGGEDGRSLDIEAVIDTGFDGELTLLRARSGGWATPSPAAPAVS